MNYLCRLQAGFGLIFTARAILNSRSGFLNLPIGEIMFKSTKQKLAALAAMSTLAAGNAMAAVPAEVTSALGDAKTDGVTVASAVLVAIVAIFAFKLMRRGL